jgi:predicted anti-sigma-YlaC factor YlaD
MQLFFSLHLSDELDEVSHGRMKRHSGNCSHCLSVFARLESVDALLQQAAMIAAPPGFTEQVVAAAFDAELRRNLWIGFLTLIIGTIIIISLLLLGRLELIFSMMSMLFASGFFSSSQLWLADFIQALTVAGGVLLGVLMIIRQMLFGVLLIPLLISLLSAAFVIFFVQRSEGQSIALG